MAVGSTELKLDKQNESVGTLFIRSACFGILADLNVASSRL